MTEIHPNLKLMSYSSRSQCRSCPRKFQLYRLTDPSREATIDTMFGHAVGRGVQILFETGSFEEAVWQMFLHWPVDIMDNTDTPKRKSLFHAFSAVEQFQVFDGLLQDYEMVSYVLPDGRQLHASELGAKIDLGDGFFERAKFDGVLRNKKTGRLAVLECKTTGNRLVHEAMYKNTGQGIGYSVVLDTIARQHGYDTQKFDVLYVVFQSVALEWHQFCFQYSAADRLAWIQDVLLAKTEIATYAEEGHFPKNGASCFAYNRPCTYFESCGMSDRFLIPKWERIKLVEDKPEDYPFTYTLDEILAAQIERYNQETSA